MFQVCIWLQKIDGHKIILSLEVLRLSTHRNRVKGKEDSKRLTKYNKSIFLLVVVILILFLLSSYLINSFEFTLSHII